MEKKTGYDAVVFDMDGVIFDSAVLIDIILYRLGSDFCRPLSRKT